MSDPPVSLFTIIKFILLIIIFIGSSILLTIGIMYLLNQTNFILSLILFSVIETVILCIIFIIWGFK